MFDGSFMPPSQASRRHLRLQNGLMLPFQITVRCQDCGYSEDGAHSRLEEAKKFMAKAKAHGAQEKHQVTADIVVNPHFKTKTAEK